MFLLIILSIFNILIWSLKFNLKVGEKLSYYIILSVFIFFALLLYRVAKVYKKWVVYLYSILSGILFGGIINRDILTFDSLIEKLLIIITVILLSVMIYYERVDKT